MEALPIFDLVRPHTLAELMQARAAHPQSRLLGGGTDLMVVLAMGKLAQTRFVDILRVPELRGIEVADDDLEAAIALREAIYRTVTARVEGRRPKPADAELLNEHGSHAQLTPRLDRTGAVRREGSTSQLLARLAADLLDLLAGPDIEKVKGCAHQGCSRLYVDSSRAQNRHWCGMGTCGNKAKVRAFRERQRASEAGVAGIGQSRTKG